MLANLRRKSNFHVGATMNERETARIRRCRGIDKNISEWNRGGFFLGGKRELLLFKRPILNLGV